MVYYAGMRSSGIGGSYKIRHKFIVGNLEFYIRILDQVHNLIFMKDNFYFTDDWKTVSNHGFIFVDMGMLLFFTYYFGQYRIQYLFTLYGIIFITTV